MELRLIARGKGAKKLASKLRLEEFMMKSYSNDMSLPSLIISIKT
jgi:hypothetical protein